MRKEKEIKTTTLKKLLTATIALVAATSAVSTALAQSIYEPYAITTYAGMAGVSGSADGTGSAARFSFPTGVAMDSMGNAYVADTQNHTIRKIAPGAVVTTLAGLAGSPGSADGTGSAARFHNPTGVAVDSMGNLYVADNFNHTIRKITPGRMVTTLAGLAGNPGSADGTGNAARFNFPYGVAVDSGGNNICVADNANHTIRLCTSGGVVTTLAGLAGNPGSADGTGNAARFHFPSGVCFDSALNIYVADQNNHTIRKIAAGGVVTTVAGAAGQPGSADGTGSAARFNYPVGIASDGANVYVGDTGNNIIRKVASNGSVNPAARDLTNVVVTTLAGTEGTTGSNDGTGSVARFNVPIGMAADSMGNIFVADTGNYTIRAGVPTLLTIGTDGNFISALNTNCPISTFSGELFDLEKIDLNLHGPMPLFFARYYASKITSDGHISGALGRNRLHNFDARLTVNGSNVAAVLNNGRVAQFTLSGGIWTLAGRMDIAFQLVTSGANFILGDPISQRLFTFDSTGKLIQIADGHGNAHTLTYTGNNLTSVSDGLGRTLTLSYNGSNQLTGVSDGTRAVAFTYNGSDLATAADALGHVTTFTYDGSGQLLSTQRPLLNSPFSQTYSSSRVATQTEHPDATMNTTSLAYDTNTYTTTITEPTGATRIHTHTATGEATASTDEASKTINMGSDSAGRRNLITDRQGDSISIVYHAASGKPASITNADGKTTSFTYASRNSSGITFYDVSAMSYPDSTSESYGYDANGNMTSHTDRAGKLWNYTYNSRGQMLTGTNPTSGVVMLTYDANGNLASSHDSDTGLTTYLHDAFSRLTRITHPDTSFVQTAYDANDRITQITDERSNSYVYTYDNNDNLKVITDPAANTTQFAYDALDRVLSVTDRLSHTASRTFNSRDDVATVTDRNNNTNTSGYDTRERRTSIVDPAGKTWSFGYDDEAMLSSFSNPLMQATSTARDHLGFVSTVTDPLSHTASINRDFMKRVTSIVDPIGRVNSYGYDARGLLTSAGRTGLPNASYRRTDLGLVDRITDLSGQNWNYNYTGPGRLSSTTDPLNRTSSFTYDNRGRLVQTNFAGGGTLVPTFDNADNLTRLLYSGGPDLQYSYDALNRLTSANNVVLTYDAEGRITNTNSSGVNFGAAYDNGSRLTSVTYNNGAFTVSYTYDSRDRLINVSDTLTSSNIGFSYDDAGRLTNMTRTNGVNGTYTYDAAGRLTRIQEGSLIDLQYTLDNAGQVTSVNMTVPLDPAGLISSSTTNFTYDAAAQISTSGYTYDARGRLTASPGHTFTFDGASRLTQIDTAALTFNGFSDILTRAQSGTTTHYFYNSAIGMQPIVAEKNDTTSQFVRNYIWTPGGQLLYSIDASSNAVSFYHFDRVGSTLALTNSAGAVTDSYAYGPYGEALGHTGSSAQPFTYVGAFGVRNDPTTSLYQMRARFYDPTSARFLSREPLGRQLANVQTLDPYAYALGNPTRYVDRTGAAPEEDSPQGPMPSHGDLYDVMGTNFIALLYQGACKERGKATLINGVTGGDFMNNGFPLSAEPQNNLGAENGGATVFIYREGFYLHPLDHGTDNVFYPVPVGVMTKAVATWGATGISGGPTLPLNELFARSAANSIGDAGFDNDVEGDVELAGYHTMLQTPGRIFADLQFNGSTVLGAKDIWYATTQSWFDKQADLRDQPPQTAPPITVKIKPGTLLPFTLPAQSAPDNDPWRIGGELDLEATRAYAREHPEYYTKARNP